MTSQEKFNLFLFIDFCWFWILLQVYGLIIAIIFTGLGIAWNTFLFRISRKHD